MSIAVSYPVQVSKYDWEDYIYEIEDNEIVNWILEVKTKDEIIQLMKDGWDKLSDTEKQNMIDSYKEAGYNFFDDLNNIPFEEIFDNDPRESIEDLVFEVIDQIEDEIKDDYKDVAMEDRDISNMSAYDRVGMKPSDFF